MPLIANITPLALRQRNAPCLPKVAGHSIDLFCGDSRLNQAAKLCHWPSGAEAGKRAEDQRST